jgi:hypothetical protein
MNWWRYSGTKTPRWLGFETTGRITLKSMELRLLSDEVKTAI